MAEKAAKNNLPKLEHVRDPKYMEVYATGALGGFDSQGGFHVIFYSPNRKLDTMSGDKQEVVEVSHKVKVVMTPSTLKHVIAWLNKSMDEYEEKFGKLQQPVIIPRARIVGAHPPETMYG